MRKKFMMAICAGALVAGAAMATPSAALADGYGVQINDGCGATYGQLVSEARQIGHISGGVHGAAYWIDSGLAAAHGCS
jgi:hypothetical protein